MSRPLKFRGIQLDNGEMIYGFYAYKAETDEHFIVQETISLRRQSYFTDYKVVPETVGQYVGITDCNGKEVYEGDIIKVPDLYETPENTSTTYHNEVIDFCEGTFRLDGRPIADDYDYISDECEVIGSIYTHPHLLEVSNT